MTSDWDLVAFLETRYGYGYKLWTEYMQSVPMRGGSFTEFMKRTYPVEHAVWRLLK